MPYEPNGGGGGGKGKEAFTSWREREGVEPVVAGPHWAEVKRKLQAAGVDVFWDPRNAAAKARGDAPAAVGVVSEDGGLVKQGAEGAPGGDSGSTAEDGSDGGDGDSEEAADGDSEVSGGEPGVGGGAPPPPPPAGRGGKQPVAAAAAVTAEAGEGEARLSWKKLFVVLVSCVGVACVACTGRKRRKRRRGAKRRKQVLEWSANAFSTNALSPLATARTTSAFGWTGPIRGKDHQV